MKTPEITSVPGIDPQAIAGVPRIEIIYKPTGWCKEYDRNPRKNDVEVDRMCASIREFGFAVPMLCRSRRLVVDGHLRLKSARKGQTLFPGEPVVVSDSGINVSNVISKTVSQ